MRIVIAGGHGQIALRLERLLAGRGDEVAGIVRRPGQAGDVLAAGAEPVVCDLESASVADVARHLEGALAGGVAARAGAGRSDHQQPPPAARLGVGGVQFEAVSLPVAAGDRLVLCTDG
ncbi:NAD(P)H-binding protein, partial [Streptomyces celluloflavus]